MLVVNLKKSQFLNYRLIGVVLQQMYVLAKYNSEKDLHCREVAVSKDIKTTCMIYSNVYGKCFLCDFLPLFLFAIPSHFALIIRLN